MKNTLEQLRLKDATLADIKQLSVESCRDISAAIDEYTVDYSRLIVKGLQLSQAVEAEEVRKGLDLFLTLLKKSTRNREFVLSLVRDIIEKRLSMGAWNEVLAMEKIVKGLRQEGIELELHPYNHPHEFALRIVFNSTADISSTLELLGERKILTVEFDWEVWNGLPAPAWLTTLLHKNVDTESSSASFHVSRVYAPDSLKVDDVKLSVFINHPNADVIEKISLEKLTTIPSEISKLKNLKAIRFKGTFTSLPASIGELQQLESLILERSDLQTIPDSLEDCKKLTSLWIDHTQVESIPLGILQRDGMWLKYIGTPAKQRAERDKIALQKSKLDQRSKSLLKKLEKTKGWSLKRKTKAWSTTLDCSETSFTFCPEVLQYFADLKVNLRGNQFKIIPPFFKQLELSTNLIKALCKNASEHKHLTHLDLRGCYITDLYAGFGALPALREIIFSSDRLRNMPPELRNIKTLEKLTFEVYAPRIPDWIGELTNIKHLIGLSEISPSMGSLTKLETLLISGGRITELPAVLGKLQNLKKLVVHGNNIKSIDMSLGNLKKLEVMVFETIHKKNIPKLHKPLRALAQNKKLKIYITTKYPAEFDPELGIIFDEDEVYAAGLIEGYDEY